MSFHDQCRPGQATQARALGLKNLGKKKAPKYANLSINI